MSHVKYQDCIEACNDCMAACEHCATACLHEENIKMMVRCIELDRSCADYEQAAALGGLELRALDGRHDLAFICGLPIGRGLTARRCA